MNQKLRDTDYAAELARGSFSDARIERLRIKETNKEEIRFSWWPEGKMAQRPLDLPETELIELLKAGIKNQVFSDEFLTQLHTVTSDSIS